MACCGVLPVLASGQTVVIKPNLDPAVPTYVELQETCTRTVTGCTAGMKGMETHIVQIMGVVRQFEPLDGGAHAVRLTFDRLALTVDNTRLTLSPDETSERMEFDSDLHAEQGGSPMLGEVFRPMLGESMVMTLDAQGRVTEFRGMRDIFAKVEKTAGKNRFFAQLRDFLNDEVCRSVWGDARMVLFANRPVSPGESWSGGYIQPCPVSGSARYVYNCTFDGLLKEGGREYALVKYSGQFSPSEDGEPVRVSRMKLVENLRGRFEGVGRFDPALGDFVEDSSTVHMTMVMAMPATEGQQPQTMDVAQECNVTSAVMNLEERAAQRQARRSAALKPAPAAAAPVVPKPVP